MNPPGNADLFRLVYRSRSAIKGTREDVRQAIDAILAVSRRRNAEAGVTGALMFTRLFFVQALEGPTAAIEAIFDRICCDLRHTSVEVVECGPVLEPAFGEWPMSHLVPDADAGALLDRVEHETELADAAAAAMKLMAALIRPEQRINAPAQQSAA
ncbi:BLUF domain-containing protein [Methylobacterium sp. E-066]|uniref:BLUF domain-containing protein n=1 Tax=Methylobacterium sp. E-066 TaxID=2836584 RepID=UPI001FB8AE97|nr:BLUF domain-containing protein [Methylobacterium sp. E-066]MCJ2139398.1 BLUF domain-containing protein [Methylobacterium sp. E-066]